MLAVRKPGEAF